MNFLTNTTQTSTVRIITNQNILKSAKIRTIRQNCNIFIVLHLELILPSTSVSYHVSLSFRIIQVC